MIRLLLPGLVLLCFQGTAQSVSTLVGARAGGMGYASASLTDESSIFNNVGALGQLTKSTSFLTYEVQSSLPGANRTAAGINLVAKRAVGGVGFFRFGDDLYSEQVVCVGIGNKFGLASLGTKVNYIQYHADGFGYNTAISLDFGGLAKITPQVSIGAYIVNITQTPLTADEYLPTKLVVGLGLKPAENFFVSTEVEKDIQYHVVWRMGAEYVLHKKVFIRAGFNLYPSQAFGGWGVQIKKFRFDYSFQYTNTLRGIHQATAAVGLGKRPRR